MTNLAGAVAAAILCAWPIPAAAQRLDRYAQTITLEERGAGAVRVRIEWPAQGGTRLTIPLGAGRADTLRVTAPAGVIADAQARDGTLWLDVRRADDAAAARIDLELAADRLFSPAAALPHGNHRLDYRFVNTTGARIDAFEATIELPPGVVVASVDEVTPRVSENSVQLPYTIASGGGRTSLTLRASPAVGDAVAVSARVRRDPPRGWLLAALGLLAAGYLYGWRDLVVRREA